MYIKKEQTKNKQTKKTSKIALEISNNILYICKLIYVYIYV